MNKVPMTVAGEAALREELEHLKKVERPRISDAAAAHHFDGREARRPPPIDVAGASDSDRCSALVRRLARDPGSVEYSIGDEVQLQHPPGTLRVVSTFSASTAEGTEEAFRVQCLFESGELVAWTVAR